MVSGADFDNMLASAWSVQSVTVTRCSVLSRAVFCWLCLPLWIVQHSQLLIVTSNSLIDQPTVLLNLGRTNHEGMTVWKVHAFRNWFCSIILSA